MSTNTATPEAGDQAGAAPESAPEEAGGAPADVCAPPDDTAGVVGAEAELDAEALARDLDAARGELSARTDELLRLKAEMDNLRKRSAREVENAHKFGVEQLVAQLLPVKDSMEAGLAAADEDGVEVASVREGLALTLKVLVAALEKVGVEEVDPAGEPFDPEFHQAMSVQPTDEAAPDSVVTVFQKGYLLNGRLVRPAMVVVAKAAGDA